MNDAYSRISVSNPDAITSAEFAEMMRVGERTAQRQLALLVRTGRAKVVKREKVNTVGSYVSVTAYLLLKKEPAQHGTPQRRTVSDGRGGRSPKRRSGKRR